MTATRYYIIFLLALLCTHTLCAQDTVRQAQKRRLLFEDDFRADSVGAWPAKWEVNKDRPVITGSVIRDGNGKVFYARDTNDCTSMRPKIDAGGLRFDSMSLSFEVYFEKAVSKIGISFFSKPDKTYDLHLGIQNHGDKGIGIWGYSFESHYIPNIDKDILMPAAGRWHRVKINFYAGAITLLINNRVEASFPNARYYPANFSMQVCPATRIRKFSIKGVEGGYDFSGINTGGSIVTHALQFDVNKAAIQREHIGFLIRLSDFLRENPVVKLEIAGHTDSDGDATANMKLSQTRADAIKAYLISEGISANRLQTKGYGSSKPLQPNTNPEAKANNRRVEFKKLP